MVDIHDIYQFICTYMQTKLSTSTLYLHIWLKNIVIKTKGKRKMYMIGPEPQVSEILWIPFIIAFNSLCNVHFVLSFTHKILKSITDLANGTFADGYFCQRGEKVQILETLKNIFGGVLGSKSDITK